MDALLSFDEYCKKFNHDPESDTAKERYDTYCQNIKNAPQSLDSMKRAGELPGELFDKVGE